MQSYRTSALAPVTLLPGTTKWILNSLIVLVGITLTVLAHGQAPATSMKVVQEAQQQLRALGYDPGAADGAMGSKTKEALKKFRSEHGLLVSGSLDKETLDALDINKAMKPVPAAKGSQATLLAQIADQVGTHDEYKSLDMPNIVKLIDENHDVDTIVPLERQAVLDVLLQRVRTTHKTVYKFAGLPISAAGGDYLREDPKGGHSMSGTIRGQAPGGRTFELDMVGVGIMRDRTMFGIGTGEDRIFTTEITKSALTGVKGSLTIMSVGEGQWLVATRMPRDRIALGPMGQGGMGEVLFPTGDGSIYGFSGEIKGFFPGVTITTPDYATVYFALVADMGVVYLAGKAMVSRDDHPGRKVDLSTLSAPR